MLLGSRSIDTVVLHCTRREGGWGAKETFFLKEKETILITTRPSMLMLAATVKVIKVTMNSIY